MIRVSMPGMWGKEIEELGMCTPPLRTFPTQPKLDAERQPGR